MKKKMKQIVFSCGLFISCFLLNACGQLNAPNEADIKSAIMEYNMMEFSQEYTPDFYGSTILMNNINNVQIFSLLIFLVINSFITNPNDIKTNIPKIAILTNVLVLLLLFIKITMFFINSKANADVIMP